MQIATWSHSYQMHHRAKSPHSPQLSTLCVLASAHIGKLSWQLNAQNICETNQKKCIELIDIIHMLFQTNGSSPSQIETKSRKIVEHSPQHSDQLTCPHGHCYMHSNKQSCTPHTLSIKLACTSPYPCLHRPNHAITSHLLCGLREEEPQTAHPMSFTWASYIAASVLTGC